MKATVNRYVVIYTGKRDRLYNSSARGEAFFDQLKNSDNVTDVNLSKNKLC